MIYTFYSILPIEGVLNIVISVVYVNVRYYFKISFLMKETGCPGKNGLSHARVRKL